MYFKPERNRALAETLFEHVKSGSTEMADETFEYNLNIYSDHDIAATEREKIFERMPMMALLSCQLPEANSFKRVRLNRSNVLVTRDENGTVRAFLNICRHRGATVELEDCGRKKRFSCPYHGWSYDNTGELKIVTLHKTVGVEPCADRNLTELPCEERNGFIWIAEDPDGSIDVASHLGPDMDRALSEYHLEDWHVWREHVFDFPQNWKIMMDGLIDGYHVNWVHGETLKPFFYLNMLGSDDIRGDHMLWGNPRKSIDTIIDEAPGESALDDHVVFANMVMPNSSFVLHPHHIEFWTMYQHPDGPHRSLTHLRYITRDKEHGEKATKRLERNWEIANSAIINEDVPVGNSIQSSSTSRKAGTIILGRNEIANQKFHRNYKRYMEA